MTTVVELLIGADAAAWQAVGFAVDADGAVALGGVRLRFDHDGPPGLRSWTLADDDATATDIDGLSTTWAEPMGAATTVHPNGIFGIDHIVINTADLERTCAAIEAATAAPLKRIREVGSLRQGFHRLGEVVIEVVTFPGIDQPQATFWGLALNAQNLDVLFDTYGTDVLSPPKQAVQAGRQIASFRADAGLGLPVAVMTVAAR